MALGGWEGFAALVLSAAAVYAVTRLALAWHMRRLLSHAGPLSTPRRALVAETDLRLDGPSTCAACHRLLEQRSGRVVHLDVDRGVTRIQSLTLGTTRWGSSTVLLQLVIEPHVDETTVQVTVWPALSLSDGGISSHVLGEVMADLRRLQPPRFAPPGWTG